MGRSKRFVSPRKIFVSETASGTMNYAVHKLHVLLRSVLKNNSLKIEDGILWVIVDIL